MEPTLTPLPPIAQSSETGPPEERDRPPDQIGPDQRTGWDEVWLVIAIWVIPACCYSLGSLLWPDFWFHPNSGSLYSLGMGLGGLSLGLFIISKSGEPREAFGLTLFTVTDIGKGGFLALVVVFLFAVIRFFGLLGQNPWNLPNRFSPEANRMLLYAAILLMALANGILLTAILVTRLRRLLLSTPWAVIVSALIGSASNFDSGFGGWMVAFVAACAYAGAFVVWRSIWPVVVGSVIVEVVMYGMMRR